MYLTATRTRSCLGVWVLVICCMRERRAVGRSSGMISLLEEVQRLKVCACARARAFVMFIACSRSVRAEVGRHVGR
jgi:hypothetical protein